VSTNDQREFIAPITRKRLALCASMALILSASGVSRAQSESAQTAPTAELNRSAFHVQAAAMAEQSSPTNEPRPKGKNEGITIHGHWTIEVRNPDGKVVAHREFENSLVPVGKNVLASLLSNTAVVGSWVVYLCHTGGKSVNCLLPGDVLDLAQAGSLWGSPSNCPSTPSTYKGITTYCFATLTNPAPSASMMLTGSIPNSPLSGTFVIDTVETSITTCNSTPSKGYSQADCFASPYGDSAKASISQFTGANLKSPVSVEKDQSVSVTVVFSFL
jgi:hypothetical protein